MMMCKIQDTLPVEDDILKKSSNSAIHPVNGTPVTMVTVGAVVYTSERTGGIAFTRR